MTRSETGTSVLQPWLLNLTMMQQSVLLTAIRGPDGVEKYHSVKYLLRWYRRCVLMSSLDRIVLATPFDRGGGSFTGPSYEDPGPHDWRDRMDEIVGEYLKSLDALPHHFQAHFMHATEILGYKHPNEPIRSWWHNTYLRLVHDLHLWPESETQLDARLGDDREGWLARNDAATVD